MNSTFSNAPFARLTILPRDPNAAARFSAAVFSSLVRQGTSPTIASGYSTIYFHAYNAVQLHQELLTSVFPLLLNGMGYFTDLSGTVRATDALSLKIGRLSILVDVMVGVAKAQNVDLNGCTISIAKVSLDMAGMAVGGATAEVGFGVVLAAISLLGTINDMGTLAQSCGPS